MRVLNLHTLLDRFRPAPPPGQPGPVGIPPQTPHTALDELAASFLLVDAIEDECAGIKADAELRAKKTLDDAAAGAARIAAGAEMRAKESREAEARAVLGNAHKEITAVLSEAQLAAAELKHHESAGLAQKVNTAVDLVRAIGGEPAKRPG